MKKMFVILSLMQLCACVYASEIWNSTVVHESRKREFKVFVPASYAKKPIPLVVVLHGGGGRIDQIQKHTGFSKLAEKEGFLVAYPQGLDKQWNDGREVIQSRAHRLKVDDTGFILKMLGAIKARYKVDAARVYVCGISNGGFMSMRLACDASGTFAAAGIVCAALNPYLAQNSAPAKKISIIMINGTEDPLVPYNGGSVKIGKKTRGEVLSTEKTIQHWLSWNGCRAKPFLAKINPDTTDNTEIEKYSYECGRAEVVLFKVIGGGHNWPGGFQYLPESIIGRTSRDINATEVLWGFFKSKLKVRS